MREKKRRRRIKRNRRKNQREFLELKSEKPEIKIYWMTLETD